MDCGLELQVRRCNSDSMQGVLIGPLRTKPGDWISVAYPLGELLQEGNKVVQFIGDPVSISGETIGYPYSLHTTHCTHCTHYTSYSPYTGETIGYPPIHVHHLHVAGVSTSHFFETHGDYAIDEDGYSTHVPAGHCVRTDASCDVASLGMALTESPCRYSTAYTMHYTHTLCTILIHYLADSRHR
jgi:hypothetical protein